MLIDPVCGKRIKRQRAHIAIDFEGTTYFLCCPRCQADFEREPKKFARPEIGEKTNAVHGRHSKSRLRDARGFPHVVRGPVT
ncbi:MAG: YHS domain-containing protein [Chloroflexi bacterium]|nr:YHS domain-containing protein [Chloroflexota bacterium]